MNNIAWAAGLFEGEGCIVCEPIKNRANSWRVCLSLGSVDKDVLDKLLQTVECGKIYGPKQVKDNKPFYYWQVNKNHEVLNVLGQFYPYLCERRRKKADYTITNILSRMKNSGDIPYWRIAND